MSTVTDTQIQVRLTQDLKEQASVLFEKMGMILSEAVRTFLSQAVAEQGMPFRAHIPNKETITAIKEVEAGGGTKYKNPEAFFKEMDI